MDVLRDVVAAHLPAAQSLQGLAIESRAHRCDQATKLKVRVKLSAREDDAVRLPRHKAFPQLLRACGNVEHIFKWCFNGRRLAP